MNVTSPVIHHGDMEPDGYVLAASVLDTFAPERLQPVEGYGRSLGNLLDVSVMSERNNGAVVWRLPNEVRRPALRLLAERNKLYGTLEANRSAADASSPYQAIFEQYVAGRAIAIEQQSLEELQASLNAVRLLEGVIENLPDAEQVRSALQRKSFIRQFQLLADVHFVGRDEPLRRLRRFVDVAPLGIFAKVRRASEDFIGSTLGLRSLLYQAPLVITGMGGMGKTALLSKFLLEHLDTDNERKLLFAYADFDKPAIWPDQPLTILAEIAQQLALQVPDYAAELRQLSSQLATELSLTARGGDYDSSEALFNLGTHETGLESGSLSQLGRIFDGAWGLRGPTLLLVLDTFEEVSQRSNLHQERLFDFVGKLQQRLPRLRVVISGRGMHADREGDWANGTGLVRQLARVVEPLELDSLSKEESLRLLESLGATNSHTNQAIFRRVGGHPLSLRLAAQLVHTVATRQARPACEITGPDLFDSEWLDHMSEGLLYRRIIAHIPDRRLQRLADPGLVLREITADTIFIVLNEPCALGLRDQREATELFGRLKHFNQLVVSIESPDVVRYRPELRQRVLKEMRHGKPQLCREIWSRAVVFYKERDDRRDEELYCRMMLNEPTEQLLHRWQPGLDSSLLRSRSELPVRARQFLDLMTLTGQRVDEWDDVIQDDSELDLAILAEEMKVLLSRGRATEALELFHNTSSGRSPRFDSTLYAVHLRAIAQAGDLQRARTLAYDGLDQLYKAGQAARPRYEDLLLLCCQITLAQHAALSRQSSFEIRTSLPDHDFTWIRELVWRFEGTDRQERRPLLVLRIATALLELFDFRSSTDQRNFYLKDMVSFCVRRARSALLRLHPDYRDVDGSVLVRCIAWLSADAESAPVVRRLLQVSQALAVIRRNYAKHLEQYLVDRSPQDNAELLRSISVWHVDSDHEIPFEADALTDGQILELGTAFRHVIRARDTRQISDLVN